MNTRRNNAQRVGEENANEAVPPLAPQNSQVTIEEGAMSSVVIRATIHSLTLKCWILMFLGMIV